MEEHTHRDALWDEICNVLRNHLRGDSCVATIKRLLLKSPWLDDTAMRAAPDVTGNNSTVVAEQWNIRRLCELLRGKQVTGESPSLDSGAIIVVRWQGSDYLVDGRR